MCTVTWLHEEDGYHVFCNRDEKYTRLAARSPVRRRTQGTGWVAPIDGDHEGTWIAANEYGVTLCLLNGSGGCGGLTRGAIIPALIGKPSQAHVLRAVSGLDLQAYAPFMLAILDFDVPAAVVCWNGNELRAVLDADHMQPLTSSSIALEPARKLRTTLFREMRRESVTGHMAFHASHWPSDLALSPCMHRADAATVSFTHVHVATDYSRIEYFPGPLCQSPSPISVDVHVDHSVDCAVHAG